MTDKTDIQLARTFLTRAMSNLTAIKVTKAELHETVPPSVVDDIARDLESALAVLKGERLP